MRLDADFGVRFDDNGRGKLGLLPEFWGSEVAQADSRAMCAYLKLARQANHLPFTKQLDGRVITVHRGEVFTSWERLRQEFAVGSKHTLRHVLTELQVVGAITVESITRPQRYRKRTVNGAENAPLNGSQTAPQRCGNCTDVRCLGTLIKVHGWREIQARKGNGAETAPQVSTKSVLRSAPGFTPAQNREREAARRAIAAGEV